MDDALASPREEQPDDESPYDDNAMSCTFVQDDGSVCGAIFTGRTAKAALNAHSMSKHKVTAAGKPVKRTKTRARISGSRRDTADRKAARAAMPPPADDRAKVYHQTLVMFFIIANTAAPRYVTDDDKAVLVAGAPGLAAALDAVGEENQTVRVVADAILMGGGGNAYVQLFMAVTVIVVPILSNHGVLPKGTGQRFGNMLGVEVVGSPPGPATAPPEPPANVGDVSGVPPHLPVDPATWDMADWQQAMVRMQPHVMVEMSQMMGMNPEQSTIPVGVPAGFMPIPEDGHRGSVGTDRSGSRDGPGDTPGSPDTPTEQLGDVAR